MKNLVVIYWSGTGNTEAMAQSIFEGAKKILPTVKLLNVNDATIEDIKNADAIALGCPSMGTEQLEENEMEPFVESISDFIKNKNLVLFGSYGWGSGEWMVDWQDRMISLGANLIHNGLIVNNTPDEDSLEECKKLGETLSNS